MLLDAKLPGAALFRVLYYLPVVTSWVVVSLLFRTCSSTDGGLINWVLDDGSASAAQHRVAAARWTGDAGDQHARHLEGHRLVDGDLPGGAATACPQELHEAAAIDGARRVASVPSRLAAGHPCDASLFVAVMLVIGGFNVFISVLLMTGGGPADETEVPLTYMYKQAFNFLDFGYGSAMSFILTVIVLVLSLGQLALFRRPRADDVR